MSKQNVKTKRPLQYPKEDTLVFPLLCVAITILLMCIFIQTIIYTPENAIRNALARRGIAPTILQIEQIGDEPVYRLLQPPLDPETRLPLENWEVRTLPGLLSCPQYAVSLDLPEEKQ